DSALSFLVPSNRIRRWLIASASAALTASAALLTPAVSPMPIGTASADDCPDIEVVFARGTNDSPGLGNVGGAFVDALRGKVGGRSVGAYAVNYPSRRRTAPTMRAPTSSTWSTTAPTPGWCWAGTRRVRP